MTNEKPLALEIDVQEVEQLLKGTNRPLLLDCREPFEVSTVSLEDTLAIPMQQIPERVEELESHREHRVVVYCHHGVRSQQVALWLRAQGFSQCQSMRGGIDDWAATIDPNMIRY